MLSTGGRAGPAHARNIGAREARGEILFFLDSDVCVHPDTLERLRQDFQADPKLDALIGSYDASPASRDFLSQYKNLMHYFVHRRGRQDACTFWSGCGAIRREVFLEHAGFDESYQRPAVEDIELGYRLRMAGRKVVLDKGLQVKHLKRWTFWGLVKTDVLDRGIPWTELILRDRCMPNDLNLELSQRVSVALAFLLLGIWRGGLHLLAWVFPYAAAGSVDLPAVAVLARVRFRSAFEAGADHPGIVCRGNRLAGTRASYGRHHAAAAAGVSSTFSLRHRYGFESPRKRKLTGIILATYILLATAYMVAHLPNHYLVFAFFVVAALIVILNNQFYLFLAAKQGRFFALAAFPFHLLYHLYNGISFAAGLTRYAWRSPPARADPTRADGSQQPEAVTSPAPAEGRQG